MVENVGVENLGEIRQVYATHDGVWQLEGADPVLRELPLPIIRHFPFCLEHFSNALIGELPVGEMEERCAQAATSRITSAAAVSRSR